MKQPTTLETTQATTTEVLRELTGAPPSQPALVSASDFSVEAARSPRPTWTQPMPKVIIIGIVLAPVFLLAALFLVGGSHPRQERERQPPSSQLNPSAAKPGNESSEALAQTQQENAQLKAKAALDGQQQLEQRTARAAVPLHQPAQVTTGKPISTPPASQPLAMSAEPPPPTTRATPPTLVAASEARSPVGATTAPDTAAQAAAAMQRWQQLARLGSYGSVSPEKPASAEWSDDQKPEPTVAAVPEAALKPPARAVPMAQIAPTSAVQSGALVPVAWSTEQQPRDSPRPEAADSVIVPTLELEPTASKPLTKPERGSPNEAVATASPYTNPETATQVPVLQEAEARVLTDKPQQASSLIAGASSPGLVVTPLVVDDAKDNSTRFAIILAKPIKDSRGNIALPASARLLVQVEGVSQAGRVQSSAIAAMWDQGGLTKELNLPAGAIQVRGEDGKPLMAKQYTDKGKEIAALDAGQFLVGAVRSAAEQFTQPNTRVQTGDGTTVVTQENPKPNLLAGALKGGTDAILDTLKERNQRAVESIQQRPPIRYVEAGRPVQVFVSQSMLMPL